MIKGYFKMVINGLYNYGYLMKVCGLVLERFRGELN